MTARPMTRDVGGPAHDAWRAPGIVGLALALGAVGGVALRLLTDLASNSTIGGVAPGGQVWSLRGNGALGVAFAGIPALLAAGWALLALGLRRAHRWPLGAALAGLGGLTLGLLSAFGPVFAPWPAVVPLLAPPLAVGLGLGLAVAFARPRRGGLLAALALGLLALALGRAVQPFDALLLAMIMVVPLWAARAEVGARERSESAAWLVLGSLWFPLAVALGMLVPLAG